MSDEEDYMSDAFLQQLPDTRPGLAPKHVARVHEQKKKEKVANEKNRQKPRAVLEREKRSEGLGIAISSDNKGFSMLQKMGYKPGMSLGKKGDGRVEPVPVEVKMGRGGLGRELDMKRKQQHRTEMLRNMSLKKQKLDVQRKETFRQRMNETRTSRQVEKDLYRSQKVCEQLDSQLGVTAPHESFFWPEAFLPKPEEKDGVGESDRLDRLEAGYSGYVQDEEEEEEEEEEKEDEDIVAQPTPIYTVEEMLEVLTLYLRTKHKYCIWCGTNYEDKDDLMKNCPGNSAELHDDL